MRQMILIGFLQAQNCTNLASSWRHPASRTDSWSPDYYRHIGRVLEAGKFHLGFFDDRLSMPDMYGRNHAHTAESEPLGRHGHHREHGDGIELHAADAVLDGVGVIASIHVRHRQPIVEKAEMEFAGLQYAAD